VVDQKMMCSCAKVKGYDDDGNQRAKLCSARQCFVGRVSPSRSLLPSPGLAVYYAGHCVATQVAPLEAPLLRARSGRLTVPTQLPLTGAASSTVSQISEQDAAPAAAARRGSTPGPDHHWRKKLLPPRQTRSTF